MLVKLTILPFDKPDTIQSGPPSGPPFVAQFNPEAFSIENEFAYAAKEPRDGADGASAKFQYIKPRTFSFDLLLDGTGVDGNPPIDVTARLELFKKTVGFSGKIHRPSFLVVNWGTFFATCALEAYKVDYQMFRPNGTPLRAMLSITLREHVSDAIRKLIENKNSPDVRHEHDVIAGDQLALLTHRYYGDPKYHVRVAEVNGLNTLRSVDDRKTLFFPRMV